MILCNDQIMSRALTPHRLYSMIVLIKEWPDGSGLNDSISCIVVGHKTTSRYYQHINFGGKSAYIKNKSSDSMTQKKLGGTWWNDSISSVRVFRD